MRGIAVRPYGVVGREFAMALPVTRSEAALAIFTAGPPCRRSPPNPQRRILVEAKYEGRLFEQHSAPGLDDRTDRQSP